MSTLYENMMGGGQSSDSSRIHGITTGTVTQNWDAEHPGMVRVQLFLGAAGLSTTEWIRVAMPYAGKDYGFYSLPEVGDEVVVSFNMGDPNRPIVIGSLWNSTNTIPQETATEKNLVNRLKTKGGNEIVFQDEADKQSIEIHTPKSLKITISDEKKSISIQDSSGKNLLTVNSESGEIQVTADKKITLSAGSDKAALTLDGTSGAVELKATKISVTAENTLELKGNMTLNAKGNMVSVKGEATCKVESGTMLELKGAMTKINS